MKRKAQARFTDFNTAFQQYGITEQLNDIWEAIIEAPENARKLDQRYGVTSTLFSWSKSVFSTTFETFGNIFYNQKNQKHFKGRYMYDPKDNALKRRFTKPKRLYRPSINPWEPPFKILFKKR